jgi:hypothetical protein
MYLLRLALAAMTFLTLAGGCGGGGGGADPGPDAAPDASFTTGTYTATWGPYTIPPGEEGTKCVYVRLGNTDNIQVHAIHNVLGEASHHFIVYRKADGAVDTTPTDCQPFTGTLDPANGAPLMITQRADETLTLPEGVVFTLKPDQLIRLELHYLNSSDQPLSVTATAEFRTVLGAQQEADFIFAGTPDIDLPSSAAVQTVGPTYLPLAGFGGANVFAITGHPRAGQVGHRGDRGQPDDPGTPVYAPTSFNWDGRDHLRAVPDPDRRRLPLLVHLRQRHRAPGAVRRGRRRRDVLLLAVLLPEPGAQGVRALEPVQPARRHRRVLPGGRGRRGVGGGVSLPDAERAVGRRMTAGAAG